MKQVFVNEDGSRGILYLVTSDTSDTTLTYDGITTIYRKRWNAIGGWTDIGGHRSALSMVEEYDPGLSGVDIAPKEKLVTSWGKIKAKY